VINYYPRYLDDPDAEAYPNYCRVKLMLYYPFTDDADLLTVDSQLYGSYADAFRACRRSHAYAEDFYTDP